MKKILLVVAMFAFVLSSAASWATTISNCNNLLWDANSETDLAGYRVYVAKDGANLPAQVVTQPATTIPCADAGIVEGSDYIWYLTAFDQSGNESAPSMGMAVEWPDTTAPSTPTGTCLQYTDAAGDLQCVVVP